MITAKEARERSNKTQGDNLIGWLTQVETKINEAISKGELYFVMSAEGICLLYTSPSPRD